MTAKQKPKTLTEAICYVTANVGAIPKTGWNAFSKYHFSSERDLASGVSGLLAEAGLAIVPVNIDAHHERDGKQRDCTLVVTWELRCGTESMLAQSVGSGSDKGDKAPMKAMTAAWKYLLFNTFCIVRGEDGDSESPESGKPKPPAAPPAEVVRDPAAITAAQARETWAEALRLAGGDEEKAKQAIDVCLAVYGAKKSSDLAASDFDAFRQSLRDELANWEAA